MERNLHGLKIKAIITMEQKLLFLEQQRETRLTCIHNENKFFQGHRIINYVKNVNNFINSRFVQKHLRHNIKVQHKYLLLIPIMETVTVC